jgi:hypothetical protein
VTKIKNANFLTTGRHKIIFAKNHAELLSSRIATATLIRSVLHSRNEIRRCIQKFPDSVNNKQLLRSNTKVYGGKTHYTDSQNRDTTAPSGRELYHLQFSLQAASSEAFGYTLATKRRTISASLGLFPLQGNLSFVARVIFVLQREQC